MARVRVSVSPAVRRVPLVVAGSLVAAGLVVVPFSVAQAEPTEPGAPGGGGGEFTDSPPAASRGASPVARAVARARARGTRVEVPEAATETDTVWANPDGTVSREVAQAPVRVRDRESGELVDIDVALRRRAGRLAPAAAPGEVSFSASGAGDLARLRLPGGEQVSLGFASPVEAPTVRGSRAEYPVPALAEASEAAEAAEVTEPPEAAGDPGGADGEDAAAATPEDPDGAALTPEDAGTADPTAEATAEASAEASAEESIAASSASSSGEAGSGVLSLAALRQGFASRVVFAEAPVEAPVLDFSLRLEGLEAELREGRVVLRDRAGEVAAASAPLRMWDSSRDEAGDLTRMVPVDAELFTPSASASAAGRDEAVEVVLRLRPDLGFFSDPETVYPVTVDPDFTYPDPLTDTYVDEGAPDTGHGYLNSLLVGSGDGSNRRRAVLRWRIDEFMGSAVTDATLSMFQYYAPSCEPKRTYVHPLRNPQTWPEDGFTWNTVPDADLGARWESSAVFNLGGGDASCGRGRAEIDVTPAVSAYTAGHLGSERDIEAGGRANIASLQLRAKSETATGHEKRFCSLNWDWDPDHACYRSWRSPTLTVTYVPHLGDEGWYTMAGEHDLNDRTTVKVNAENGNVVLKADDVDVAGRGMDLQVARYYNSRTEPGQDSTLGSGWSLSLGPDVYLERGSEYTVYYHKAGGAVYGPFTREKADPADPGYREFDTPLGGVGATLRDRTTAAEAAFVLTVHKTQKQYYFTDLGTGDDRLYLTKVEDRSGNTITLRYAAGTARWEQITDTAGRTYQVSYSTGGRLSAITESTPGLPDPRTWSYGHDGQGALTSYTDPAGGRTEYAYTAEETQTGDPSGVRRLLDAVTDPVNASGSRPRATLVYHDAQVTAMRYAHGAGEVGYDYDYRTGAEHDRCALPGGNNDPDFDASTNVVSTNTDAGPTTYCFRDREQHGEGNERTVRVVDGNGDKAKQDYSSDNQPTRFTSGTNASDTSGTGSTVATYGGEGFEDRLESVTMPKDDGASDAASGTVQYNHTNNPKGGDYLPTSAVDMNFACTAYRYDATGRLTDTWIERDPGPGLDCSNATGGSGGTHYQQGFNADGTVAWRQDPNGTTDTRTKYDYWSAADAGFVPGTEGQLKQETRPGGNDACTATTSTRLCTFYTYDTRARLVAKRDGRGVVTTYAYDALDRTTGTRTDGSATPCTPADAAAGHCVAYAYDAAGNMTSREDVNGVTTFDYDQLNRQRAVTTHDPGSTTQVGYDYNDDGNLTTLTQTENGEVVNAVGYTYDPALRPQTATVNPDAADPAQQLRVELDHNADGKHTTTVFPHATTPIEITREHAKSGRLRSIDVHEHGQASAKRARLEFDYDYLAQETNLLRSITTTGTGSAAINGTTSYTYGGPAQNRKLASVTDTATGAPTHDYTFDDAGNLREHTDSTGSGSSTYYGYDRAGQLCWEDPDTDHPEQALVASCATAITPTGAADYQQDPAGNSLGTTADPYTYNDLNQVATIGGTPQQYRDLGNDLRIATGTTTLVNSNLGVLSRTEGTGYAAQTTYYLRDPDGGLLAAHPAITHHGYRSQAVYYLTNHQDSVIMLLNAHGDRAGWYRYTPYGQPTIVEQTAGAATTNPWRYLSAHYSGENGGYHHLGARIYNNKSHFTQPDPERGDLGEPLRTLSYGYAGCNPANRSDAEGRWWGENAWDEVSIWVPGDLYYTAMGCAAGADVGLLVGGTLGATAGGIGAAPGAFVGAVQGCAFGAVAGGALGENNYFGRSPGQP